MHNITALLVLIGYNAKYDKFELILIVLLSHEDSDIFTELNNFLKNSYSFKTTKINFDFGLTNLTAIKKVYTEIDNNCNTLPIPPNSILVEKS